MSGLKRAIIIEASALATILKDEEFI